MGGAPIIGSPQFLQKTVSTIAISLRRVHSQALPAVRQSPHILRRASSKPILPAHTARDKHASIRSFIAGHVDASNATSGNARFISCQLSA